MVVHVFILIGYFQLIFFFFLPAHYSVGVRIKLQHSVIIIHRRTNPKIIGERKHDERHRRQLFPTRVGVKGCEKKYPSDHHLKGPACKKIAPSRGKKAHCLFLSPMGLWSDVPPHKTGSAFLFANEKYNSCLYFVARYNDKTHTFVFSM